MQILLERPVAVEQRDNRIPKLLFREHDKLDLTLRLIRIAHGSQLYNGLPYWHHPVRVLLRMNWWDMDSEQIYGALFHDTKEDTELADDDLRFYGYNERVVDLRNKMTRDVDESYRDYIRRLIDSGDIWACRLKLADMYENSNNVRFLPPEKRKIIIRYGKSIKEVQEFLKKTPRGTGLLENTISGELDKEILEAWIGQTPTFL